MVNCGCKMYWNQITSIMICLNQSVIVIPDSNNELQNREWMALECWVGKKLKTSYMFILGDKNYFCDPTEIEARFFLKPREFCCFLGST